MSDEAPFSAEQLAALAEPLNRSHVKTRSQSGQTLSYVEGWHAIAEANRIFGFGAWDRETIETRCVSERERLIGRQQKQGWGVTYTARVRVRVGAIVRDGCGAGHGIDADLGQAHESAIKEAETDAMKRALMTFGNPFGLALYDKQQREVADESQPEPEPEPDCARLALLADQACTKSGLLGYGIQALCQELTGGQGSRLADLPTDLLQRLAQHGATPATVARCNEAGQILATQSTN
jgi:DNA recombination protein Rad52